MEKMLSGERVAILDFGAQYGKVIDRRVRELKVQSEMFPLNTTARHLIELGGFKAIIISGGPNSVFEAGAPSIDPEIFNCGLPVLGICYGFQLMNKMSGGRVSREHIREDGATDILVDTNNLLFSGLSVTETVSHSVHYLAQSLISFRFCSLTETVFRKPPWLQASELLRRVDITLQVRLPVNL